MKRRFLEEMVILACLVVLPRAASANDLTWDAEPWNSGIQEGGGFWDLYTDNWYDGANHVWNNGNYDTAVFGNGGDGGVITIPVSTSITAGGLRFRNERYSLDAYTQLGAMLNFDTASPDSSGTISIEWTSPDSQGFGPWFDGKLSFTKNLVINGTVVDGTDFSSFYLWNDTDSPNDYPGRLTISSGRVVPCGMNGKADAILSEASVGTTVNDGGTLALFYKGNYHTNPLTLNGTGIGGYHGALQYWPTNDAGLVNWQSSIILASNSAISAIPYDAGGILGDELKISGVISEVNGPNGLGKYGTAKLTLTNVNTYTGPTLIVEGTLSLSGGGQIDSKSAITNNATFLIADGMTMHAVASIDGTGTTQLNNSARLTTTRVVQGEVMIGIGATLTIAPLPSPGGAGPVPEPNVWMLLMGLGGPALLWKVIPRRKGKNKER